MFNIFYDTLPAISDIKKAAISNVSLNEVFATLSPELSNSFITLITILKTIGIIFVIYLIFLIVKSIMEFIEKKRIKKIYEKVNEIDKKVDALLKCHDRKITLDKEKKK